MKKTIETETHRIIIENGGVTIHERKEDLGEGEIPDEHLTLSVAEIVEISTHVERHKDDMWYDHAQLGAGFRTVSQAIVEKFPIVWEHYKEHRQHWDQYDFQKALEHTYTILMLDKEGPVWEWYEKTLVSDAYHQQCETLFWRYFHRHFSNKLLQ